MPLLLPELPESLISSILQHVPLKQRLSHCALVCQAWASAAAATAHLDVHLTGTQKVQSLQSWINSRAEQLTSISIHCRAVKWTASCPTLQLPCRRLTQLERLDVSGNVTLQLHTGQPTVSTRSSSRARSRGDRGASSSAAARAVALLPRLQIVDICCSIALKHLQHLSQLTALTSLYLYPNCLHRTASSSSKLAANDEALAVMSDAVAQLSSLRELTLGLPDICTPHYIQPQLPARAMQHISHMQALGLLKLTPACCTMDELLPHLPPSLTALLLSDVLTGQQSGAQLQAAAARLTRLRFVVLTDSDLHPHLLRSWTALQHLSLDAVSVTFGQAADDAAPAAGGAGGAAAGGAAAADSDGQEPLQQFLLSLQQLSQLQHLQLCDVDHDYLVEAPEQLQFAAVTASTQLTRLHLSVACGMPLPPCGLRQCFVPGRPLPALRVLRLSGQNNQWSLAGTQPQYSTADLLRVAACGPGLQELVLEGVTAPMLDWNQLLPVLGPDLQTLSVHECSFGSAAVAALARLCGLRSLTLVDAALPSVTCLSQLTALSRLSHLRLMGHSSGSWHLARIRVDLDLSASPEAQQPDVAQQLADRLNRLKAVA